jgi:hypothetical protein
MSFIRLLSSSTTTNTETQTQFDIDGIDYILSTELRLLWVDFFEKYDLFMACKNKTNINLEKPQLDENLKISLDFHNVLNQLYYQLVKCENEKTNEKFCQLYNDRLLWIVEIEIVDVTYKLCDIAPKCKEEIKLQVRKSLTYPLKEVELEIDGM